MMFDYIALNDLLNLAAFRVYRILEGEGYPMLPIPASPPYDHYQLKEPYPTGMRLWQLASGKWAETASS